MAGLCGIRTILAGVALAGLAASVRAEPPATFPAVVDRAGLVTWLRQETDIAPSQVVAVSPSAVTAVLGTIETTAPNGLRMALRAEAIDPKVGDREGVLSWHMLVEVDCPGRKLRQGPTTGYVGRNLLGEGRQIRPGSAAWIAPPPGAQLENVWRAAGEAGFERPLAPPHSVSIAQAATPAAAVTPPLPLRPMLVGDARPWTPAAAPKAAAPVQKAPPPPLQALAAPAPAPLRAMAAVTQPPAPHSAVAVQLGAMATLAAAEALLADIKGRFMGALPDLSTTVAPASGRGRTVYRALVTGFSRDADAGQFCKGLKTSGLACFVR